MWPLVISNSGYDVAVSGTEARGNLFGVYAVSSTGDLENEDIIVVGANRYMVLDVPTGKTFKFAFGPIF
jgi:hypothetical protein